MEARNLKSRHQQATLCEGSREESFLASSSFWWLQAFLGLWLHHSNLCFRLCLTFHCVCSLVPSMSSPLLKRILVIAFRAHLDNPGWSHLESLSLIAAVRLFIQIGSHSQVLGHMSFGGHHSTNNRCIGEIFLDLWYILKKEPGAGGRREVGVEHGSSEEKGNMRWGFWPSDCSHQASHSAGQSPAFSLILLFSLFYFNSLPSIFYWI